MVRVLIICEGIHWMSRSGGLDRELSLPGFLSAVDFHFGCPLGREGCMNY